MKLVFYCGICGKQETLELNDKTKTYTIGREFDDLDVRLCVDSKKTLSRIQAHIKWDKNAWRIFDGWTPEGMAKGGLGLQKTASFAGTYIKRGNEIKQIPYGQGEDIRLGDDVFFVPTAKADKSFIDRWLKQAPTDLMAAFYKYDGFVLPEDVEYYDGFKYKFRVMTDEELAAKMRASNMFVPLNFSKDLEIGKELLNSCLGLDIRSSTEVDLETQRDYWIPQFNTILNELLKTYTDYLLILVGDGAYVCFLGERPDPDVNFMFALKFLEMMHRVNAENLKKKIKPWRIRLAVNIGKDLLSKVEIGTMKTLNVYGNCITTTSRLMSNAKSEGDEIIVGAPFHQEFNNKKFYKAGFSQIALETTDSHGVKHPYYIYKKLAQK